MHLLEDQRVLKNAFYIGGAEDLLSETFFDGSAENYRAVALENVVQPIDIGEPLPGPAMNDLGQVLESRLSQLQQLLALSSERSEPPSPTWRAFSQT
jgi:hypothetical protein